MAQNYQYIVCKTRFENGCTNAIQTYGSGSEGGNKPPEGYAWFPEEFMDEFYIKIDPRSGKSPKCAGFVDLTFAPGQDSEGNDIGEVCTSCKFNWDLYDAYIATLPDPIPGIKEGLILNMSSECNRAIEAGVDITLNEEAVTVLEGGNTSTPTPVVEHFELKQDDQMNIAALFNLMLMGGTEYIYHSSGKNCRSYSATEIAKIYVNSQLFITQNVTYNNVMKNYINSLKTEEELEQVTWGMELPAEFKVQYDKLMATATEQVSVVVNTLSARYNLRMK